MLRYRYRTETLIGPWRDTRAEAEGDAVAAGQALFEDGPGGGITWRVIGEIEVQEEPVGRR